MIQGYFADDFEPEQTYAFILMMNERFGFEFIGIGATLMLFYRSENLSDDKAEELLQEAYAEVGTFLAGMKAQLERISEHIEIFESIDKDALSKIIKEYYN